MSILQSSPGDITSIAKVWTSARHAFLRALLLMKACSSWRSHLGHVCANLRRSWPNVGALLRLLVEVCWKWLGLWGLDQGYVEGFAAVMSLVLGHAGPLGCFFSAKNAPKSPKICTNVPRISAPTGASFHKQSNKNDKEYYQTTFLTLVGPHFSCFFVFHTHYAKSNGTYYFPCWPLEASRGGMLEVSRAVGSRSGLCWRLCCCYATCFAAMLVHLDALSLRFDLGRWSFA